MAIEIYTKLKKHWTSNKFKFYKNQDLNEAGKFDCEEIYLNEPIHGEIKNELAKGLLEIFISTIKEGESEENIAAYLNRYPLIQYYFVFVDKLDILIKEGIFSKEELFKIGMNYLSEKGDNSFVKLGLTLLRFADNNEALETLCVFSNHNEYIFYSVEGIKEYEKCNSIIFEIAKQCRGYGKIIAVTNLEAINEEIRDWLIIEGSKNDFLESVLVAMTFNDFDYQELFDSTNKSKKKYEAFTRNLKILYNMKSFFISHISLELISLYWEYFNKFNKSFDNAYVMCAMLSLFYKDNDDEITLIESFDLNEEEEQFIEYIIEEFLKNDFTNIIKDEIVKCDKDIKEIIDLALALDISITFDEFNKHLENNKISLSIYNYIMTGQSVSDKQKLITFADEEIPYSLVASGAENINEDDIDLDYVEDTCLYVVIKNMGSLAHKYVDLNLKALNARYSPTRYEALENLKKVKNELSKSHVEKIRDAYSSEVNISIKRSMGRVLESFNKDVEVRYENIEAVKVKPHSRDILLTKVHIAGTSYRDLTLVEKSLTESQTVYLKREKENPYDENAIMILTSDGYLLGYVPRKENYILKNLMDWGKIIYGNIQKISDDYNNIEVELYLSYADIMMEVTNTFNMVTEKPRGYLN